MSREALGQQVEGQQDGTKDQGDLEGHKDLNLMGNLVKDQQGEEGGDQQGRESLGKGRLGIDVHERRRCLNFANYSDFITNISRTFLFH